MEALNRFASSFSSSVTSTVFSTVSTIKDVLPGNPVTREFEVTHHIASAGPINIADLVWKIYDGFKKSTKQKAAIFVLEKRALDQKFEKQERDFLLDLYRKSISQLTRLRHPQILTVQHPLEESRDCLAFATEPVFCSLANILGRNENMPQPIPSAVRDYKLFDVEIKYGLLQLSEGLAFLHDSVKMLHRNLSPETIVLNHQGAWKIFGLDFCIPNSAPANQNPEWKFPEYNHNTPPEGYPDLDFLAPEYALSCECNTAADQFSLGMIAFTLYNTKPLFCNSGNWGIYKKNASELKTVRESNFHLVPADLKDYLKMLLSLSPDLRPTAAQFAKIGFFDDIGVKTLNNLDSQFQWDNLQKSQFYKGLPSILPKLPHRVCLHRVVPCLAKEFVNPPMVPFVLPAVLMIAEEASKADFVQFILPDLKPVMKMTEPVQVLLIFMQRMDMLLAKTPPHDVKNEVLPMIYRALESDTSQIIELCLSIIPGFAGLLDYQAMKNALLPRIKKLCLSTTLLSVRVNSLICLGKLLPNLDKWLVIDEILPMLQNIPSREPAVVMGIIGIYKMALNDENLGLTKEVIATKSLPFLFPLSIENGLTLSQYNVVMNLIRQMITKVEDEHKVKLEQLNSLQNEQKSALQISMSENFQNSSNQLVPPPSAPSTKQQDSDDLFSGLGLDSYVKKKDTGAIAFGLMSPPATNQSVVPNPTSFPQSSVNLSLEEKKRLVQQTEATKRMQEQPKLMPMSSMMNSSNANNSTRDLTATLMQKNLNQMNISGPNFSAFQQSQPAMASSNSMNLGSTGWGDFAQPTSTQLGAQRSGGKPDLSAFDSLLSMPSSGNKTSMNQLGASKMMAQPVPSPIQNFSLSQQKSQSNVKNLTADDISDLLS